MLCQLSYREPPSVHSPYSTLWLQHIPYLHSTTTSVLPNTPTFPSPIPPHFMPPHIHLTHVSTSADLQISFLSKSNIQLFTCGTDHFQNPEMEPTLFRMAKRQTRSQGCKDGHRPVHTRTHVQINVHDFLPVRGLNPRSSR